MSSNIQRDPQRPRETLAEPGSGSERGPGTEEEDEGSTGRFADTEARGEGGLRGAGGRD